jgi:hypothetical protein
LKELRAGIGRFPSPEGPGVGFKVEDNRKKTRPSKGK